MMEQVHVQLTSLFSENGRKETDARLNRLDEATSAGDINDLKVLLDEDPLLLDRVLTIASIKDNPLHIASHLGHIDFVKEIVCLKPKLAYQLNEQGQSPLHIAVAHSNMLVVKELLKAGYDLCVIQDNPNGLTPIHVAVNKATMEIIKELAIASETAMSIRTYKGETLFHFAVKANRLDVVDFLSLKFLSMAQEYVLNASDCHGNTGLHLAMAGAQLPVMTYLLSCESIDVNSRNSLGLTPLDVLSLSSHDKSTILPVAEMLMKVGGKHGEELRATGPRTTSTLGSLHSIRGTSSPNKRKKKNRSILSGTGYKNNGDAGILIVVATLVATITFQAALNPPGGSISMPYQIGDLNRYSNNTSWYQDWRDPYPAGVPVLFWRLRAFFLLDAVALLISVSIILILLTGVPQKSRFMMKLLVSFMWLAVFCTLMAFLAVFYELLLGIFGVIPSDSDDGIRHALSLGLFFVWIGIFGVGSIWISILIIIFLLRKASIKPNWFTTNWFTKIKERIKICSWLKNVVWLKKVVCITLIIGVVVIWVLVNVVMYKEMMMVMFYL